jgi:tetratricopeptide (TPR) repeat protein
MRKQEPRKRKPSAGGKPKADTGPPAFDFRVMEQAMAELQKRIAAGELPPTGTFNIGDLIASGGELSPGPRTPLEQAQQLIYQAWESPPGRRRVELAREALQLSPDCADAYVLLAEEAARSLEEARDLYEQGVKAGERALGPRAFKDEVGYFWGILETRPYMRARAGLAACLWLLGERQKAIEHYTEMLRLNPNDNQGIRYLLVDHLLEEGDDKGLGKLLNEYKEDASASWLYTRALWTFRQEGAGRKANTALRKALEQNRHVPAYLLGTKKLPKRQPEYIGFGDDREAVSYAADAVQAWRKTPGALEWLAEHVADERR